MEKRFNSRFALKAILAVAIVLALVMTYSISLKGKPEGFSLLYFDPAGYSQGNYVAILENRENSAMDYSMEFYIDGQKARELQVALADGAKASYAVLDYASGLIAIGSTVEVRALRKDRDALSIYATNRVANQKG